MKRIWGVLITSLVLASMANAQITRTATFENYSEGQNFKPSFNDPISEISFSNCTAPIGNFVIEYSSTEFGGGNFLTSAGYVPGPNPSWAADFGFTGNLPQAANLVSVGVTISSSDRQNTGHLSLEGLNAQGSVVAQQSGVIDEPDPFTLEISSSQYNIASFQITSINVLGTGYDNIAYTILPEPAPISCLFLAIVLAIPHSRKTPTTNLTPPTLPVAR